MDEPKTEPRADDDADDDRDADDDAPRAAGEEAPEALYTLTDISRITNISMPTLQRYKKLHQDRLPSQGIGRSQRYLPAAIEVFKQLKEENIGRRGRPRKADDAEPLAVRRRRTRQEGLMTLTEIGRVTGISYPTLLRYVRRYLDEIPHRGSGRSRRYPPEAIEVFKRLRHERRGTERGSGEATVRSADVSALTARIKELERSQRQLERVVLRLEKELKKPILVTVRRS
ncbi:MAG: helix-turn-helix domain-containing protein [Acidobacteriota bacterium]